MRLLLLNNNPAVSRLIKLSAEKAGYELDEFEDYGLVPLTTYDLILVDNELYDENALVALREHTDCDYVVYICQRGSKKPEAVNVVLEKPFLPTDFLVLLEKIKNVIESHKAEEVTEDLVVTSSATTDAFDIDQIDTLESEDDMLPINLLEEYDNDFKKEESSDQRDSFDDLELDDLNLDDNALEDKQSDLEEKELTLEDPFSFDAVDSLDKEAPTSFEDFDFEEEPSAVSSSLDEEEEKSEEEEAHNPSILDKDDIDEVKQLLDESEEEEEKEDEKEIDALSLDALGIEEDDAGTFFLDEDEKEEPLVKEENPLALEADDMSDLTFEDVPPVEDEMEEEPEEDAVVAEDQEEIIDDFAEVIEEKIEEEKEQALEEEEFLPSLDSALSGLDDALGEIDSLDDLNETMLKVAFGEDVEEEAEAPATVAPKSQDIEVIRDEIENSIARSISSLAQSDILREALKGMRLNISITFDEK
ncbi:hypothetical protein [Sulfurospirillum halorespirans]|uniref:Highly acidic protein n=1 Tax=Sulfurospirillum halorespirans DSM 13726 TaxID=1193502 RepID=A0A1D7TH65_9BACT|nr:hypothetical protein [Sulfurospirillum halorespirans]AOO64349.1 hypothetical protein SHALO_0560 [Sulfurospirillum halorespirans DSM 13726]